MCGTAAFPASWAGHLPEGRGPMTQHHSLAVLCRTCGHGYDRHLASGGPCTSEAHSSPSPARRCPCSGFLWIDPEAPSVVSYTHPPTHRA